MTVRQLLSLQEIDSDQDVGYSQCLEATNTPQQPNSTIFVYESPPVSSNPVSSSAAITTGGSNTARSLAQRMVANDMLHFGMYTD